MSAFCWKYTTTLTLWTTNKKEKLRKTLIEMAGGMAFRLHANFYPAFRTLVLYMKLPDIKNGVSFS